MRTSIGLTTTAIAAVLSAQPAFVPLARADNARFQHVLLLSIDGIHASDLATCVAAYTCPNLATLSLYGITYTNARTSTPSDSFPGLLAQVTGGTPKTTGVYYDDSYDRTLFSLDGNFPTVPGSCSPSPGGPGTEVVLGESIDYDQTQLFSGGINPAYLPNQKNADGSCTKVFPHDFLKVNTIF